MRDHGLRVDWRDWAWAAFAVVVGASGLLYSWGVVAALRDGDRLGALVLGVPMLVVFGWFTVGAWRRTAWGAPPGGARDHRELHRLDRRAAPTEDPEG